MLLYEFTSDQGSESRKNIFDHNLAGWPHCDSQNHNSVIGTYKRLDSLLSRPTVLEASHANLFDSDTSEGTISHQGDVYPALCGRYLLCS